MANRRAVAKTATARSLRRAMVAEVGAQFGRCLLQRDGGRAEYVAHPGTAGAGTSLLADRFTTGDVHVRRQSQMRDKGVLVAKLFRLWAGVCKGRPFQATF